MKFTKLLALVLALLMVVGTLSLVACGGDKPDDGKKDDPAVDPVDPGKDPGTDPGKDPGTDPVDPGKDPGTDPADPSEAELAKLQELFDTYDFGGDTVNLLCRDGDWVIIDENEYNEGDALDYAVYTRQSNVEEALGVAFNYIEDVGSGDVQSGLTTDVSSGTGEYHIVSGHMKFDASTAVGGFCLNLNKLPNLDLKKDYWNQSYTEKWGFKTLQYWTTGDITTTFLSIMIACFVNGDYWTESFPDLDPYALVENGEWTIEKAAEICAQFGYTDSDNDQTRSDGDTYAWVLQNGWTASSLAYGVGMTLTEKSGSKYELKLATPENEALYAKLLQLSSQPGFIKLTDGESKKPMENGLCLITHERLYRMNQYRDMETPYYVMPLPKADAEAEYHTPSYDGVPIIGVTAALSPDLFEEIGTVLEAMAIEGKQLLTPAYYEVGLQAKYSRDEGSFRSLEIIRATGWCDFGFAWCQPISGIDTILGDGLQQNVASVSALNATYGAKFEGNIKALYTSLNSLLKKD